MLRNNIKKIGVIVICIAMLSSMAACQKSPEGSLVVNKDLDKLIEEAQKTDTEKVDIKDIADVEYDDYVTSFEDSDLGVKVNVNAKVDIPKTDHLSVFRVEQAPFTQEFIDKVRAELLGDAALYDGAALRIETKSDIEAEIASWRSAMNDTENESVRAEYQKRIDELQAKYESAPTEVDLTDYPSDGKLCATVEKNQENPYYSWAYGMYPDGDILSVVTDGANGKYAALTAHNSSEKSNQLDFSVNKIGFSTINDPYPFTEDIMGEAGSKPENYIGVDVYSENGEMKYAPLKGETCTLSLEEAVSQANELIGNLGLDEFGYYDGGVCTDYFTMTSEESTIIYRTFYSLKFYRNIDGTFLTQSSGTKNNMSVDGGSSGGAFTKKSWGPEIITVNINDNGIIGFTYSSPIEITETVVENAAIKSFEDVKDTFEKMMVVTNAGKYTTKVFDIDRVRLSYSRISEADSYDTGLIVPVWDFSGYCETASDGIIISDNYKTALAINAIDGSIIDPDLGY